MQWLPTRNGLVPAMETLSWLRLCEVWEKKVFKTFPSACALPQESDLINSVSSLIWQSHRNPCNSVKLLVCFLRCLAYKHIMSYFSNCYKNQCVVTEYYKINSKVKITLYTFLYYEGCLLWESLHAERWLHGVSRWCVFWVGVTQGCIPTWASRGVSGELRLSLWLQKAQWVLTHCQQNQLPGCWPRSTRDTTKVTEALHVPFSRCIESARMLVHFTF